MLTAVCMTAKRDEILRLFWYFLKILLSQLQLRSQKLEGCFEISKQLLQSLLWKWAVLGAVHQTMLVCQKGRCWDWL